MAGSTKTQTATNTSEPWDEQIPYLTKGFEEAERIYNQEGPEYYPGTTVAPFSAEQNQAFQMGADRATGGNATMQAAEGYAQDVLGGKYLQNPNDDQVFANIQSKVMPSVNSQFSNSGRYGSGLHADTSTRALTESYAPYAASQYQQGLDRMGNMAQLAPMFAANDYTDIGALEAIGRQKQGLAQQEIGDAFNRYTYNADLESNKLGQYLQSVGGNWGGTTTSQTPYYQPSMFSQIAGGALGLGSLFMKPTPSLY